MTEKQAAILNSTLEESKKHLSEEYGISPDRVWLDARSIEDDKSFVVCAGTEGAQLFVLRDDDNVMLIKEYSDALHEMLYNEAHPAPVSGDEER